MFTHEISNPMDRVNGKYPRYPLGKWNHKQTRAQLTSSKMECFHFSRSARCTFAADTRCACYRMEEFFSYFFDLISICHTFSRSGKLVSRFAYFFKNFRPWMSWIKWTVNPGLFLNKGTSNKLWRRFKFKITLSLQTGCYSEPSACSKKKMGFVQKRRKDITPTQI